MLQKFTSRLLVGGGIASFSALSSIIPAFANDLPPIVGPDLDGSGAYVPWDVDLFYDAIVNLRSVIGTAFNIGFWIFIIITGIYLIVKLVSMIGN